MMEQFGRLSNLQTVLVVIVLIGIAFYFKLVLIDLLSRLIELINSPLDILLDLIEQSETEVGTLTGRQKTFNLAFAGLGALLLVVEFWNLREISVAKVGERALALGSHRVDLGSLVAVGYILLTVSIGVIGFEMIGLRKIFSSLLGEIEEKEADSRSRIMQLIIGVILIVSLFLLAYMQGQLGMVRYGAVGEMDSDGRVMENFFFWMGFLTPLIVSLALIRFDVFIGMVFVVISTTIKTYQRLTSLSLFIFEGILNFAASPMDKLGEIVSTRSNENTSISHIFKPLGHDNMIFRSNMEKANKRLRYESDPRRVGLAQENGSSELKDASKREAA